MKVLVFVSCVLLLVSCSSDENQFFNPQQEFSLDNVQSDLIPYVRTFVDEAASRGIQIDIESYQLVGEIVPISEGSVAGRCTYGSHIAPEIIIDEAFWNASSTAYREYVVFHELGHCILEQDHREGCLENRTYSSIMRSGLGSCRDNYTAATRQYYLDELFSVHLH